MAKDGPLLREHLVLWRQRGETSKSRGERARQGRVVTEDPGWYPASWDFILETPKGPTEENG